MKTLAALCLAGCFVAVVRASSSSCDIGQTWYSVAGALTWVSSGHAGVWGVNSAGNIYYRVASYVGYSYYSYDGRNYGFSHSDGTSWQQVEGGLAQIDVGKDVVWGVNSASSVYYRAGITASNPTGTGWVQVTGLAALHVSVSDVDGKVWAVGTNYLVYRRVGISDELPGGSGWEYVSGISSVRNLDIGGAGVWATTTTGSIYYRIGSRSDCQGSAWQYVPGTLYQVVSGGDAVFGVQQAGAIWYRLGITAANPTGTEWIQVPGALKELSVSTPNNALWGVTASNAIVNRHL